MEKINIEYLKTDSIEDELEIEQFWIDIRKELYKIEEDHSLVYYNVRRGHASAYIGDYAGIFFQILITICLLVVWDEFYIYIYDPLFN